MTKTVPAWLALLAAGAAAGGCGSAQPPAVERPALSSAAAAIIVPTEAAQAASIVLDRASGRLVRRCMAARGFRYDPPPPLVVPASALPPAGGGYRIYEMARGLAAARRGGDHAREPSRGYLRALDGRQAQRATVHPPDGMEMSYATGGCQSRAIIALHGSLAAYYTDVARRNGVVTRVAGRAPDDAALRRATASWRACMRRHGHRFRSPRSAREAVLARYVRSTQPGRVRTFELRIAAADRACAITSGVYRHQGALDRAVIAALGPADRAVLEDLARSRRAAVKRARAIVSASPSPFAAGAHTDTRSDLSGSSNGRRIPTPSVIGRARTRIAAHLRRRHPGPSS